MEGLKNGRFKEWKVKKIEGLMNTGWR